ncbi:MAG: YfiT family bacillithiol transferase [Terriglobales bacterium]
MTTAAVAPDVRFPVGPFKPEASYTDAQRAAFVQDIADLPSKLRSALAGLNEVQLNTPYRDGGWTVRQTVHHLADSHANSYIRLRFAATEDNPTIMPYNEAVWAELPDAKHAPVEPSLQVLEGLHQRWVSLLKSFKPEDWKRTLFHPERGKLDMTVLAALYSWHCRHHVAHITELRKRMSW